MKSIIFLTSSFPFDGGEQFIEEEIKYWENTKFKDIYLLPHSQNGDCRYYPENIKLLNLKHQDFNFVYVMKALLNPSFYNELNYIIRNTDLNNILDNSFLALKSTAQMLKIKEYLEDFCIEINGDIVIYSYWNSIASYAAILLKNKNIVSQVFSRAHRFDLYEYEQPNNYMPLKRQFIDKFDKIFFLSSNALRYFQREYKSDGNNFAVSPLGVKIPSSLNTQLQSIAGTIQVLSLSYCSPVKQIDKILKALEEYASLNNQTKVLWNHIGDGPLKIELIKASRIAMQNNSNLEIHFLGSYTNSQVHEHLNQVYYDFIINCSRSEGIPVSLMEAMSYGIPAIAPDVGEISNLVNNSNGYLLPTNFNSKDIIIAIDSILSKPEQNNYRSRAVEWVSNFFNANINYPSFISQIEKHAGLDES